MTVDRKIRDKFGRFTQGNPGKPKGAKDKYPRDLAQRFLRVFDAVGGEEGLAAWARDNRTEYYRLASKLFPRTVDLAVSDAPDWCDIVSVPKAKTTTPGGG